MERECKEMCHKILIVVFRIAKNRFRKKRCSPKIPINV